MITSRQGQGLDELQATSSQGLYGPQPLIPAAAREGLPSTEIRHGDVVTLISGDAEIAAMVDSHTTAASTANAAAIIGGSLSAEVGGLWPPTGGVVGIAHRGASAELPEHTREAYELAVAEGGLERG